MIGSDFEKGSLGHTPPVEAEPDELPEDIAAVLADAEQIVNDAEPAVVAEVDNVRRKQRWWRRRRGGRDDGDDFGLSSR